MPRRSADDPASSGAGNALASDLLLAEFIHRSANDLAVACAEVHVASRSPTLSGTRDRLAVVTTRLHTLASIQRLLQRPRTMAMNMGNALCELCHFQAEARFADQGAFIHLRSCDIMLDASRGWALLMIVSELLTNAARHAFAEPGGLAQVELIAGEREITCLIRDNGIGRRSAEQRTGSALVARLALEAGISLEVLPSEIGSSFELRLPVTQGDRLRELEVDNR